MGNSIFSYHLHELSFDTSGCCFSLELTSSRARITYLSFRVLINTEPLDYVQIINRYDLASNLPFIAHATNPTYTAKTRATATPNTSLIYWYAGNGYRLYLMDFSSLNSH